MGCIFYLCFCQNGWFFVTHFNQFLSIYSINFFCIFHLKIFRSHPILLAQTSDFSHECQRNQSSFFLLLLKSHWRLNNIHQISFVNKARNAFQLLVKCNKNLRSRALAGDSLNIFPKILWHIYKLCKLFSSSPNAVSALARESFHIFLNAVSLECHMMLGCARKIESYLNLGLKFTIKKGK